jgi:rod shape-determining protein MreD
MALLPRRDRFAPPPTAFEQQLIPVVSVMLASLAPLLPMIVSAPVVPPFGFMMLLAWRLLRNDLWPVWAALPLGVFDDLFSGAPIGTAMALWTMAFVAIDAIDRRWVWRDHIQDWGIAIAFVGVYLLLSLWLSGGKLPLVMLIPQLALAAFLFPVIGRTTAMLDRWRLGR